MKKHVTILVLMLVLGAWAWADCPLSAVSRYLLHRQHVTGFHAAAPVSSALTHQAFIAVEDDAVIDSLRAIGVEINAVFNGFVTARIPAAALSDVTRMKGVSQIALGTHVHVCNDSARYYTHADAIHSGNGFVTPLQGEGVIVGVIDTGIDYNHVNWRGADGESRLRAAYLPCDSTGTAPVINGNTLPGSGYDTPEAIAMLTTDNPNSSHGTHTTGTAAGGYTANGLWGLAPGADIVACGIPENQLTDINIANSISYIIDYADRVGKPCVINMSLASNDGPNDGTSFLCRTFTSMSGPGRIFVLSAGNEGNVPICFHHNLSGEGDTVTTLLRNAWGGLKREGYVSMWNDGPQEHVSRLVIINRQSGEIEYTSAWVGSLPEDSVFTVSSEQDPAFAQYYTGTFEFVNAVEPQYDAHGNVTGDGRFHSYWILDATSLAAGHLVGIQYTASQPTSLAGWCPKNTYFYTYDIPGITGGSPVGSISDLATSDDVISVGAYCTRSSYVNLDGDSITISGSHPTDIASFSSYGPDERGISRPDVCAPGYAVISSANRFESGAGKRTWVEPAVVDGMEYPYYANQGTSMSAPVVTGSIALLLQLDPTLTTGKVRQVLQATSIDDSYVLNGNPERWGSGKLDIAAAVNHVIGNIMLHGDVNGDGEVNLADVMVLIDILLDGTDGYDVSTLIQADVNRDKEIRIGDINCVIDLILNR